MSVEINVDARGLERFERLMEHANIRVQQEIHGKLQDVGIEMHATARHLAPVKTGRLRDSIFFLLEDWRLKLGCSVPYAAFQEFGTRHFPGRYFLTEAINLNLPKLAGLIRYGMIMAIKTAARE